MKALVFDMDGTIVNLYEVNDWLRKIRTEDSSPYKEAPAMYDDTLLNDVLFMLKSFGWRIVVTSWTAKGGTPAYNKEVRKAKIDWLKKHDFPFDEVHIVKYGTTKAKCTRHLGKEQILFDDNADVRKGWHLGRAVDANSNIITELFNILDQE